MEKKITASNRTNIGPKPITITFFKHCPAREKSYTICFVRLWQAMF